MSKYQNKTISMTDEAIKNLQEVRSFIGDTNESAAIRYCIKQTLRILQNQHKEAANG